MAYSELVDGTDKAVICGSKLRIEIEKNPFRICVYDKDGTLLHADITDLAYREDSNKRRIHTSHKSSHPTLSGLYVSAFYLNPLYMQDL